MIVKIYASIELLDQYWEDKINIKNLINKCSNEIFVSDTNRYADLNIPIEIDIPEKNVD